MNNKAIETIKLEKIIGSEKQIEILFQLLKNREHNISNVSIPTFDQHIKFVKNHPYRAWYLIKVDGLYVGSSYVMESNCLGISLLNDASILPQVIDMIYKKHKPLKEIKSIRPPHFYINIAPENRIIESQLNRIGAIKIQSTYSLASITINP
ncbi:hypothetical protein [Janthinobacterium sp. GW458P]|uniref:hypothetical protein n=1 Tax=Janthinobacterium sp. GW458P TaxID=1981504 RepID=UPI0011232EB6|nr:hypothetical protein [Janthinobacterium sp. GW458P]MBE3024360.1 hypothetical protein [Janthinobacterium sp. GW458P]